MDEANNTRMTTNDMKMDLAKNILIEGSLKHHDELIVMPQNDAAWNNAAYEVILHKVTKLAHLFQLGTTCRWILMLLFYLRILIFVCIFDSKSHGLWKWEIVLRK